MRGLIFIFIGAIGFWGCRTVPPVSSDTIPQLILEHQRGACFGPCPIFLLRVFDDGSATLSLQKVFPEDRGARLPVGDYQMVASNGQVQNLGSILKKSDRLDFENLGGTYDNPMIMDLPSIRTRIRDVEVIDRYEGPGLESLYEAIELFILDGEWEPQMNE
ncbi:MAG: DUF6438 domain-containing protein [Flavobacteriales bacterium]